MKIRLSRHEGKPVLTRLERYWRLRRPAPPGREQIRQVLFHLREVLHHNGRNTRIVSRTWLRLAAREEIDAGELEAANRALRDLLKTLGITVVGILPGSFITLPGLFALARRFNIDLLPDSFRHKD